MQQKPVMRLCISCRKTYDRKNLLKITNDYKQGIMFQKGMGRSAYICKSKACYSDSKIKKKLQKALKNFWNLNLLIFLKKKLQAYNNYPNKRI